MKVTLAATKSLAGIAAKDLDHLVPRGGEPLDTHVLVVRSLKTSMRGVGVETGETPCRLSRMVTPRLHEVILYEDF